MLMCQRFVSVNRDRTRLLCCLMVVLCIASAPPVLAQGSECLLPGAPVEQGDQWINILVRRGIPVEQARAADVWWRIADYNRLDVLECSAGRCESRGRWSAGATVSPRLQVRLSPGQALLPLKLPADLCERLGMWTASPGPSGGRHRLHFKILFGTQQEAKALDGPYPTTLSDFMRRRFLPGPQSNGLPDYDWDWLTEAKSGSWIESYQEDCALTITIGDKLPADQVEQACIIIWSNVNQTLCGCIRDSAATNGARGMLSPLFARYLDPKVSDGAQEDPLGKLYEEFNKCRAGEQPWSRKQFFAMWSYRDPPSPMNPRINFFLGVAGLDSPPNGMVKSEGFQARLKISCPWSTLTPGPRKDLLKKLDKRDVPIPYCD